MLHKITQMLCMMTSLLFVFITSVGYAADTSIGSDSNPIKVAVIHAPPYVFKKDGGYTGIMIDYWRYIAQKNNWIFKLIPTNNDYKHVIREVEKGKYDIALGDFPTSADIHPNVNFSAPMIMDYVSIITQPHSQSIWVNFLSSLWMLLPVLVMVFSIFMLSSLIFWWFQSRKKKEYTVSDSIFNTAVAMINGGFVDNPEGLWNRINLIGILITGTILQSIFFAAMAHSNIEAHQAQDPYFSLEDLNHKYFVIDENNLELDFLKAKNARFYEVPGGIQATIEYYRKHRNQYDGLIAMHTENVHYLKKHPKDNLIISRINLKNELMAMVINKSFPKIREIDRVILGLQDEGESKQFCNQYIPSYGHLCEI